MIKQGFPKGEYLLIENRQACGFDALPQGGLAIIHVDQNANDVPGYPGQESWPRNGNHYKVALLQADGAYNLEQGNNRGDANDLFHAGSVNSIGPKGVSSSASYPNTLAYQGGKIINTGITISNISAAGPTMTFDVEIPASSSPTASPTSAPTLTRTDAPTASPTQPKEVLETCEDSSLPFKVNIGGKFKSRTCSWVAKARSTSRCALDGVSAACPSTCNTCSSCVNSPLSFKVEIDGKFQRKRCKWVGKNRMERCKLPGVDSTCRSICKVC